MLSLFLTKINKEPLLNTSVFPSQTLSEKTKELDKLRSDWTSQTSCLSNRHSLELQSEREKVVKVRQLTCMDYFLDCRRLKQGKYWLYLFSTVDITSICLFFFVFTVFSVTEQASAAD